MKISILRNARFSGKYFSANGQTSDHSDINALPQSDDEENVDDVESVPETAAGISTAAGTKRKRKSFQPVTPEDVAERRVKVFVFVVTNIRLVKLIERTFEYSEYLFHPY